MATVTTSTTTCDLCHKPVDTESTYIDAMAYGATFHLECLQEGSDYSPLQVIKALGLDDIYFRHRAVRGKLIYHFPY